MCTFHNVAILYHNIIFFFKLCTPGTVSLSRQLENYKHGCKSIEFVCQFSFSAFHLLCFIKKNALIGAQFNLSIYLLFKCVKMYVYMFVLFVVSKKAICACDFGVKYGRKFESSKWNFINFFLQRCRFFFSSPETILFTLNSSLKRHIISKLFNTV